VDEVKVKSQFSTPVLRAVGIEKRYPGTVALAGVDMDVCAGEVHALLGENGAGKSTLTKIFAGDQVADGGRLELDGSPTTFRSPRDSLAAGIRLVTQERSLAPSLSVAENLFMGDLPSRVGWYDRRGVLTSSLEVLERVGLGHIDPRSEVGRLRPAEQQLVEVGRAIARSGRVLILDEPTAALGASETDRLFDVVERLRQENIAVIYISHRIPELSRIADRVTVLRDGRAALTCAMRDTSEHELIEAMIGRELQQMFPERPSERGAVRVRFDRVTYPGVCEDVSLSVRAGEIVGVFGLVGSGATEIPHLAGGRAPGVTIDGSAGFIPADRRVDGLFAEHNLRRNLTAASLPKFATTKIFRRSHERAAAVAQANALGIRPPDPERPIATFSGGNQQKSLIGRWMLLDVDVFLLAEPTRGVDVGARAEIYELLVERCRSGAAVLLATSDLDEAVGLSDRLIVMSRGRIAAEFQGDDINPEAALSAAVR
jgi:ribose transport system ATP-binding protein